MGSVRKHPSRQLELEFSSIGVHGVLPLGPNVIPEQHQSADSSVISGAHQLLSVKELRRLGKIVPVLPKLLQRGEAADLVDGLGRELSWGVVGERE